MKMLNESVIPYAHPIHGNSCSLGDDHSSQSTRNSGMKPSILNLLAKDQSSFLPVNTWLEDRIGHLGWRCVNIPRSLQFEYYGSLEKVDSAVDMVIPYRLLPMLRIAEFASSLSKRIIVIRDGGGMAVAICYYLPSFITSTLQYQAVWLATLNILGRENIVISRYLSTNARLLTWYE